MSDNDTSTSRTARGVVLAEPATPTTLQDRFELAYAAAWAKARRGPPKTIEELAAEIRSWREGNSYGDDLPRLQFCWEGFQWCAALLAYAPVQPIALTVEYPAGAIVNGRTHIERLENIYRFECEAGSLSMCDDWHGLKRCFEHLAAANKDEPTLTPAACDQAPEQLHQQIANLQDAGEAVLQAVQKLTKAIDAFGL